MVDIWSILTGQAGSAAGRKAATSSSGAYQAPKVSAVKSSAVYQAPTVSAVKSSAVYKPGTTTSTKYVAGSPANMPSTSPLSFAGETNRFNNIQKGINVGSALGVAPTGSSGGSGNAAVTTTVSGGGGGGGGINVSSLFGPLFDALRQQRKLAESRYAANSGQIQNLYGQLIGARSADVDDIDEAYKRLQQAAASRGEATIGKMEAREATRLSQNEAVLQSMGVAGIGSSVGDIASQSAGVAQNVELMNQSNWAGMLDAMGKTSQEIARADVTSYGYAQMEDIAQLQAAKEDYLQNLAQQEFELKFQEQQAKLQAQQAAAANAARIQAANIRAQGQAAEAAARAEQQQYERTTGYLKSENPVGQAVGSAVLNGLINANEGQAIVAAYSDWISNSPVASNPMTNRATALADLEKNLKTNLSPSQKSVLRTAVSNTFNK